MSIKNKMKNFYALSLGKNEYVVSCDPAEKQSDP